MKSSQAKLLKQHKVKGNRQNDFINIAEVY